MATLPKARYSNPMRCERCLHIHAETDEIRCPKCGHGLFVANTEIVGQTPGKTKRSRRQLAMLGILLVTAYLYVWAYVVLVEQPVAPIDDSLVKTARTRDFDGTQSHPFIIERPKYRVGGRGLERFFRPIHVIDRRIRPDVWIREVPRSIEAPLHQWLMRDSQTSPRIGV